MNAPQTIGGDVLFGASQIADFLGCSVKRVYYLTALGRLPVFRLSSVICARKSTILQWIKSQEVKNGGPDSAQTLE